MWRLLILKFVCHSNRTGSVGNSTLQALNLQELENIPDIISEKAWNFHDGSFPLKEDANRTFQ